MGARRILLAISDPTEHPRSNHPYSQRILLQIGGYSSRKLLFNNTLTMRPGIAKGILPFLWLNVNDKNIINY
jgi:hypothetical protein